MIHASAVRSVIMSVDTHFCSVRNVSVLSANRLSVKISKRNLIPHLSGMLGGKGESRSGSVVKLGILYIIQMANPAVYVCDVSSQTNKSDPRAIGRGIGMQIISSGPTRRGKYIFVISRSCRD